MEGTKAIELLNKALGCMKSDPKDCVRKKCSMCKHHATKEDGIEAISMGIEALKQQDHRCYNCYWEKHCKLAQRLGVYGYCSDWDERGEDGYNEFPANG